MKGISHGDGNDFWQNPLNSHISNSWVPPRKAMRITALWKTGTGRTAADAGRGVQTDSYKVKGRVKSFTRRARKLNTASLGHCTGWDTMNVISLVSLLPTSPKLLTAETLPSVGVCPTCAHQPGKAGMLKTVSFAYLYKCIYLRTTHFLLVFGVGRHGCPIESGSYHLSLMDTSNIPEDVCEKSC